MAITIAKSTGGRVSLTDAKLTSYSSLASLITIRPDFDDVVLEFFAGSDGIVIENLGERFMNEIQIPEVRAFYSYQLFQHNLEQSSSLLPHQYHIKVVVVL